MLVGTPPLAVAVVVLAAVAVAVGPAVGEGWTGGVVGRGRGVGVGAGFALIVSGVVALSVGGVPLESATIVNEPLRAVEIVTFFVKFPFVSEVALPSAVVLPLPVG